MERRYNDSLLSLPDPMLRHVNVKLLVASPCILIDRALFLSDHELSKACEVSLS